MTLILPMTRVGVLAALVFTAGCGNQPTASTESGKPNSTVTKPAEVSANKPKADPPEGQIIGQPAKNSKFAKLQPGQTFRQVGDLIGEPDDIIQHETGKRWIPFYYGSDVKRLQVYYKNEGCLTYTGGNVFGGGTNKLIRVIVDPKGGCWRR